MVGKSVGNVAQSFAIDQRFVALNVYIDVGSGKTGHFGNARGAAWQLRVGQVGLETAFFYGFDDFWRVGGHDYFVESTAVHG